MLQLYTCLTSSSGLRKLEALDFCCSQRIDVRRLCVLTSEFIFTMWLMKIEVLWSVMSC